MISIIIPAYNEERYLPECLESLSEQDYSGEYEIIVADNGSTDNTAEIARSFKAKVISCFEKQSVFYARQVGAEAARGEIIVQADADTVYPEDWLQKISGDFTKHPGIVAVAGRYIYKDPPAWAKIEYSLKLLINRLTILLFGRPLFVSGANFAFKRNVFIEGNGYKGLNCYPDQIGISSRLSKKGKVFYDNTLYVLTSSRRVKKPFVVILREVVRNTASLAIYFGKLSFRNIYEFSTVTISRRVAAGLSLVLLVNIIFIACASLIPSAQAFGQVYYEGDSSEKVIALSFDDGPDEPYTSQILDILAEYSIKATFFVIGEEAERYPETIKRMAADGHVIGNHSYSHDVIELFTENVSADLQTAQNIITDITGVTPYLYRPPHSIKTPWEIESAEDLGMVTVTWSINTDELDEETDRIQSSVYKASDEIAGEAEPGGIILLYDGIGITESKQSLTVLALPQIIERLLDQGYSFVTVPELLDIPAYIEQESEWN